MTRHVSTNQLFQVRKTNVGGLRPTRKSSTGRGTKVQEVHLRRIGFRHEVQEVIDRRLAGQVPRKLIPGTPRSVLGRSPRSRSAWVTLASPRRTRSDVALLRGPSRSCGPQRTAHRPSTETPTIEQPLRSPWSRSYGETTVTDSTLQPSGKFPLRCSSTRENTCPKPRCKNCFSRERNLRTRPLSAWSCPSRSDLSLKSLPVEQGRSLELPMNLASRGTFPTSSQQILKVIDTDRDHHPSTVLKWSQHADQLHRR